MKKYYIVGFAKDHDCVKFVGNFKNLEEAKWVAIKKMTSGNLLVGFDLDFNAEYTDNRGCKTVRYKEASEDEKAYLGITYGSEPNIPSGCWYWTSEADHYNKSMPNKCYYQHDDGTYDVFDRENNNWEWGFQP
jgi:hypothetical protein